MSAESESPVWHDVKRVARLAEVGVFVALVLAFRWVASVFRGDRSV